MLSVLDHQAIAGLQLAERWGSLLVIGNVGPQMWRQIPGHYFDSADPVDRYAANTVSAALQRHAKSVKWQLLFPMGRADCPPLQTLGRLAGWHADSPLGTGINRRRGLWFAYRAVVAVSSELNGDAIASQESPCLTCASQACVKVCPAAALQVGSAPELRRCSAYRLSANSQCAETCIARTSCPVAPHHRYDDEQIRYHYGLALPALSRWLSTLPDAERKSD